MPHGADSAKTAQKVMRAPVSGGFGQTLLETAPGEISSDFRCLNSTNKPCIIGRSEKDDLVFYELDPMQGQEKELGRTKTGTPGPYMSWDLSSDGTQVAVSGATDIEGKVRLVDLTNHTQRDLSLPPHLGLWSICWASDARALYTSGEKGEGEEFFLARLDLAGKSKIIASSGSIAGYLGLVSSPDGHFLAYTLSTLKSNAFLLERF
jgi:hypothetical protein